MQLEKLQMLIDRLGARTDSGQLTWSRGATETAVQMSFPDASVVLDKVSPFFRLRAVSPGAEDKLRGPWIELRVLDAAGQPVASINDDTLKSAGDDARARRLLQLYEDARYRALGGDQVIDQMLKALS